MRIPPTSGHRERPVSWQRLTRPDQAIEQPPANIRPTETSMLDIILIAAGLGFFALSVAYAYGCDRL
jgi:hypothetical protein